MPKNHNIQAQHIVVDTTATLGSRLELVDVTADKEYVDGRATGKIINYAYDVMLPERGGKHLVVKIQPPLRAVKELGEIPLGIPVEFDDLRLSVYTINGNSGVSAKASGIRIVNDTANKGSERKG